MMTFDEFENEVKNTVKDYLPDEYKDANVSIKPVSKIGMKYDSLTVRFKEQSASPAANLNSFYKDYENGTPFDEIMSGIADVIQIKAPENMKNMSWLLDYEQAKKHLYIRVCNADKNKDIINNAPHKIIEDLIITCHVAVDITEHGLASTIVNNDLLEHWGVSSKQVFDDSMESSPKVMPVMIDTLLNEISKIKPDAISDETRHNEDSSGEDILLVSNVMKVNGASALFYPGVLEELGMRIKNDYLILPSSTNEVIIMPDSHDYKSLERLVVDTNKNLVPENEQLSDHIYRYSIKEKLFERIDKFEERINEKEVS